MSVIDFREWNKRGRCSINCSCETARENHLNLKWFLPRFMFTSAFGVKGKCMNSKWWQKLVKVGYCKRQSCISCNIKLYFFSTNMLTLFFFLFNKRYIFFSLHNVSFILHFSSHFFHCTSVAKLEWITAVLQLFAT